MSIARSPAPTASLRAAILDAGATCNCFSLRQAARVVTQFYDDALRPSGLRSTQFTLLALVLCHGSIGVSELAAASVSERTTVTRNLAVLERDGLIRIRTGDDERVRLVELTAAGLEAVTAALPLWRKAQATMTRRLGGPSLAALRAQLGDVVAAVSEP